MSKAAKSRRPPRRGRVDTLRHGRAVGSHGADPGPPGPADGPQMHHAEWEEPDSGGHRPCHPFRGYAGSDTEGPKTGQQLPGVKGSRVDHKKEAADRAALYPDFGGGSMTLEICHEPRRAAHKERELRRMRNCDCLASRTCVICNVYCSFLSSLELRIPLSYLTGHPQVFLLWFLFVCFLFCFLNAYQSFY